MARRVLNLVIGAAGMLAVSGLTNPARTFGQAGATSTEFDTATITAAKPVQTRSNGGRGGGGVWGFKLNDPHQFTAFSITLKELFRQAYRLQPYQLAGGPPWINQARYDVAAESASLSSPDELRLMLRKLLADRFQLKFHIETQDLKVMALVVAKDGPKLYQAGEGPVPAVDVKNSDGSMPIGMSPLFQGLTMEGLATRLSGACGTLELPFGPVVDMTGIKGKYDLRLMTKPNPGAVGSTGRRTLIDQVCEALPQVGLEFRLQRVPIQIYTVDSAEEVPTRN